MSNRLEEILSNINEIAPFPQVAVRAMKLNRQGDLTPGAIVDVIETDPGISAAVLREANSAARGARVACASIRDAGNQLGTRSLNRILLKACASDCFSGLGESTPRSNRSLWNESLVTACTARFLANQTTGVDPDTAYTVGLIQNLGHIVLDRYLGDARSQITEITQPTDGRVVTAFDLIEAERKVLGTDHAELGGELAKRWNFPAELANAIQFHHQPELAENPALCQLTSEAEELSWHLLSDDAKAIQADGENSFEELFEILAEEGVVIAQ